MQSASLKDYPWRRRYSWETGNPVDDFYVPALSRSIQYDRKAGYFSSTALAVAAQGIAKLIQNGGRMRLLVGCHLLPEDVQRIKEGYELKDVTEKRLLENFGHSPDRIKKERLAALAWMIAAGTLEIRIAIPLDADGNIVAADPNEGIFHEKCGIFTDAYGNKISFSGSINETESGWLKNRESFHVYKSWAPDADHLKDEEEDFELHWSGRARWTVVLDFPEALKKKLIKEYLPSEPPRVDPLEQPAAKCDDRDFILLNYIKDAPYLPGGDALAEEFSTVTLWPHQEAVVDRLVNNYPQRYLIADEVGLGKTIEAGLALKKLLLTKEVGRCLLLVPKSVIMQWQEELREKFNLNTFYYNGSGFVDAFGNKYTAAAQNPWDSYPVIIASSHLVKRRERWDELLESKPWDLIILDEAHHARRISPTSKRYRPNNLLRLVKQLEKKTRGFWLLTATPMQIDPVELWDLLVLLGMGGKWGASEEYFKEFFAQLRNFPGNSDVAFLLAMAKDYLDNGGVLNEVLLQRARKDLGLIHSRRLERTLETGSYAEYKKLNSKGKHYLKLLLHQCTPLKRFMSRNDRELLRRYREEGLLKENIPRRNPQDIFIEMGDEGPLYDRIEEYLTDFYKKAREKKRYGLGFILTIYRRRLTSSLYAIQKSLERRLSMLKSKIIDEELLDELDDVLDETTVDPDILERTRNEVASAEPLDPGEIDYLEDFLRELSFTGQDTKLNYLFKHLEEYRKKRSKIIIFTQYTDTMDYLRGELAAIYQSQLACYSSRGGEYYANGEWAKTTKEDIKERFLNGEVSILICTDAASEGLNLQTCGVLINYDMPWNPMRVEQRIGRIDRIGQVHEVVDILNYYYRGTVEEEIYSRLKSRIAWFSGVVGKLQPILARLPEAIQEAAMAGKDEKPQVLERVVGELEREIQRSEIEAIDLENFAQQGEPLRRTHVAPVGYSDMERICKNSPYLRSKLGMVSAGSGIYRITYKGKEYQITFDPAIYDKHPDTVQLFSYGNPIFDEIMQELPREIENWHGVLRVALEESSPPMVKFYHVKENSRVMEIDAISLLEEVIEQNNTGDAGKEIKPEMLAELEERLRKEQQEKITIRQKLAQNIVGQRISLIREKARQTLEELLHLEGARLDTANAAKIMELKKGTPPFGALINIANINPRKMLLSVNRVRRYQGLKPESLGQRISQCRREADKIVKEYKLWSEKGR